MWKGLRSHKVISTMSTQSGKLCYFLNDVYRHIFASRGWAANVRQLFVHFTLNAVDDRVGCMFYIRVISFWCKLWRVKCLLALADRWLLPQLTGLLCASRLSVVCVWSVSWVAWAMPSTSLAFTQPTRVVWWVWGLSCTYGALSLDKDYFNICPQKNHLLVPLAEWNRSEQWDIEQNELSQASASVDAFIIHINWFWQFENNTL